MLHIDLKNAMQGSASNFSCLFFQLLAKADAHNRDKLSKGFPVEVHMMEIYHSSCPYIVDEKGHNHVNYWLIEKRAREMT